MRVMHVIASLSGYGAEHFVGGLLPQLAAGGEDVAALTVYPSKAPDALACAGIRIFDAARKGRADATFFARMVRAMRRFRPDIVHTHMHNGKYWGRLAAVAAGVPHIVHTEHDPNFRMHGFERAAAAILMHRTERFIAFSAGHRTRLASAEGIPFGKIAVIPNGIAFRPMPPDARERGRQLLGAKPGELAIVMVGRLETQKNHALALRTFACLPAQLRENARVHIIGDGSLEPTLRALASQLEIDHAVSFLGFRRDSLDLIAGGDAMLMTSHSEAMPIALIEGMSMSLPVVTAPWLGAAEMLDGGELGYVSTSFAPEDVAFTLTRALSEPQEAHAKGASARAKALAEYDLRTATLRHRELYHLLAGTS